MSEEGTTAGTVVQPTSVERSLLLDIRRIIRNRPVHTWCFVNGGMPLLVNIPTAFTVPDPNDILRIRLKVFDSLDIEPLLGPDQILLALGEHKACRFRKIHLLQDRCA